MSKSQQDHDPLSNLRLFSVKQVCELTLYSRVHLYRMERDGKFIRRVQVGSGRVGYYQHELETWMRNRPRGPIPEQLLNKKKKGSDQ